MRTAEAATAFSTSARSAEQVQALALESGEYVPLLTRSGSRGPGAQVWQTHCRIAIDRHEQLTKELDHLARLLA